MVLLVAQAWTTQCTVIVCRIFVQNCVQANLDRLVTVCTSTHSKSLSAKLMRGFQTHGRSRTLRTVRYYFEMFYSKNSKMFDFKNTITRNRRPKSHKKSAEFFCTGAQGTPPSLRGNNTPPYPIARPLFNIRSCAYSLRSCT